MELQKPFSMTDFYESLKELLEIKHKYYELLMQVSNKYPDETRHETALRYIKQAENQKMIPNQAKHY